ncbi:magnesium ion transporter [Boothiomyces macroporosus]|uniref:Magnesium transporter n=1 Tax=Boothiomyces macroporosus TaxID=261099 RepID=A0AAD5UB48_9FUNG|nr:magnesium ion transporter [Boothiomyces macroporosus]
MARPLRIFSQLNTLKRGIATIPKDHFEFARLKYSDFTLQTQRLYKKDLAHIGLKLRDVRSLDNALPTILPRKLAILVNMGQYRGIIKHDEVLLVQTEEIEDFSKKLQYFLETFHLDDLEQEYSKELPLANKCISSIGKFTITDLKLVLQMKNRLNESKHKVEAVLLALQRVLDNDEDMIQMYISEKHVNQSRDIEDHQEVELLFENYYYRLQELLIRYQALLKRISSTEEIVNLEKSIRRNDILLFELQVTSCAVVFSFGAFIASIFGMNLVSGFESNPTAFYSVLLFVSGCLIVGFGALKRLIMRKFKI